MTVFHALAIVLALWPSPWPCAALLWWLWRHRRVRVPRRGSRRSPVGTAAHSKAKPEEVPKKLLYLCAHLDGAGCRTIAHAFNRWHGGWVTVGKTWVWEFMREHEAEIRERRRRRKRHRPRFVPAGHAWSLDLTFVRSPFGTTFTVLGILDAGSRKLLRLEVLPTKCALVVLGHLLIAIGIHGLPRVIRTDNEVIFTSKLWLATLKALGVVHRRGPPCQPWRNGRIERAFGTLKTALRGLRFATALGLQATLNRFAQWYNEARPHQSLGGLTPAEVWQGQTMTDVRRSHDDPTHRARIVRGLLAFHRLRCPRG
ncbi:MAG TPA: integrase core domain-containing protein [Burkholderiaceae bacterium]